MGDSPPRSMALHQWPYSDYTSDPAKGNGTMAYAIRTQRYRYIANVKYDAARYRCATSRQPVVESLYVTSKCVCGFQANMDGGGIAAAVRLRAGLARDDQPGDEQ